MNESIKHLPAPNRDGGICLALSGGGFRATLFHLGTLRRLNELSLIGKISTISSVSGGSIMSLCLAKLLMDAALDANGRIANFATLVDLVHDLTSYNLRRHILLQKIEPTHWGSSLPELVARELEHRVTDKSLADLPVSPRFVFCATDMVFGSNWEYARDRVGDYEAGYKTTGLSTIKLAHAAAASACFPPIFKPMETGVAPSDLKNGKSQGPDADACRERIRLSDGGVYDNMGLEPIWKHANTLLVSDAGGVFEFAADRGTISDIKRYPDIVGNQARALRKRWLMSSFITGNGPGGRDGLAGTYWCTGNARSSFDPADNTGYSKEVAQLISQIRTDLDSFSGAEAATLENHAYLLTDIALEVHLPDLYENAPPVTIPYPDWMDEAKVKGALKDSAKQHL
jgi:NTE family protein